MESNDTIIQKYQETLYKTLAKWPMVEIGRYLETFEKRNAEGNELPFMGVDKTKQIVPTTAKTERIDPKKYLILEKSEFVFSGMQTGRDICIRIALWNSVKPVLLSPAYTTFKVCEQKGLLSEYFFLNFKSYEMDRLGWFKSDSSVRSNLDWDRFCEIKIPLPPIEVQRAYVKAYKGLTDLIEQNEALVKELEKTAQACVAECRQKWQMVEIGKYLEETDTKNEDLRYSLENLRGISILKKMIPTKADMEGVSLQPYKIVKPLEFAFVSVTSRNGEKISLAINDEASSVIVSSSYTTFKSEAQTLLPEYLFLQFKRPEFDRYARFNSWGSARETFTWDDMCRVKIPLPPVEVQRAIVSLYHCAEEARKIAEEARKTLKTAIPAMIQSAAHHQLKDLRERI